MNEPRITITFTAKDTQDTTLGEAMRRLENAGWQHVQVEYLDASHSDRDRKNLADNLADERAGSLSDIEAAY